MTRKSLSVSPGENSVDAIADDLNDKFDKVGEDTLALAKACCLASAKLTDRNKSLLMAKLKFTPSDFSKYAAIGANKAYDDPELVKNLPAHSFSTLYELGQFEEQEIRSLVEAGTVHPKITRREVEALKPTKKRAAPTSSGPTLPKAFAVAVQMKPNPAPEELKALKDWIKAGEKLAAVERILDKFQMDALAYKKAAEDREKLVVDVLKNAVKVELSQHGKSVKIGKIKKTSSVEDLKKVLAEGKCTKTIEDLRRIAEQQVPEVKRSEFLTAAEL